MADESGAALWALSRPALCPGLGGGFVLRRREGVGQIGTWETMHRGPRGVS